MGTTRLAIFALASLLMISACAAAGNADQMKSTLPQQAAAGFLPQVEGALAGMAIGRESFEMRANRCDGPEGDNRDDVYYIWVGLRGAAPGNDIAAQLVAAHARWQAQGWDITRFRKLDNGGVNLAATDPATGNTYTLDSGFQPSPAAYLVGFFNTPCYQSPEGKVDFGMLDVPQ